MTKEACPRCGATEVRCWVLYGIMDGEPLCEGQWFRVCGECSDNIKRVQVKKLTVVEQKTVPLQAGYSTLVGYLSRDYPTKGGNCCDIGSDETGYYNCRNMNTENVEEAGNRWPELKTGVLVEVLSDKSCRVIDERLPKEWRRHQCSTHGYYEDGK